MFEIYYYMNFTFLLHVKLSKMNQVSKNSRIVSAIRHGIEIRNFFIITISGYVSHNND